MKHTIRILVPALLLGGNLLKAQEAAIAAPSIIGPVADGTATPAQPKDKPAFDVVGSVTKQEGDKTVTVRRVMAPALPVLPPVEITSPVVQAQLALAQEQAPESKFTFISATVYGHQKSLVRWWHGTQEYSAWSNLDFNHLCGFSGFQFQGQEFSLLMGVGNADAAQQPQAPALPVNGPSFVIVQGDANNPEALAVIQGLHELYKTEGPRLKLAYEKREQAKATEPAPSPKNTVIHFWKRNPQTEQ